jgi:hypothetical protein
MEVAETRRSFDIFSKVAAVAAESVLEIGWEIGFGVFGGCTAAYGTLDALRFFLDAVDVDGKAPPIPRSIAAAAKFATFMGLGVDPASPSISMAAWISLSLAPWG